MGPIRRLLPVVLAVSALSLPHPSAAAPVESRALIDGRQAAGWEAVESTLTQTTVEGEPALLFRVVTDSGSAGPSRRGGRPHIQWSVPADQRDWRGWEQIRLRVLARSSAGSFPSRPLGITIRTGDPPVSSDRSVPALQVGEWQDFTFDLLDLSNPGAVGSVTLSLARGRYADKKTLEFAIARLELLRYSQPTLLGLHPLVAVAFADAGSLPVQAKLLGLPAGATTPLELRLMKGAEAVASWRTQAQEGEMQLSFPLPGALSPGDYAVSGTAGGSTLSAPVRLVASPWQEVRQ
jgi:hypothetical protein